MSLLGFYRVSQIIIEYSRVLQSILESLKSFRVSWIFLESSKVSSRVPWSILEDLRISLSPLGSPRNFQSLQSLLESIIDSPRVSKSLLESFRVPQSILESSRVTQSLLEPCRVSQSLLQSSIVPKVSQSLLDYIESSESPRVSQSLLEYILESPIVSQSLFQSPIEYL